MGFKDISKMDQRKLLVLAVLSEDKNLSEAARHFNVSRPTARMWVKRAKESSLAELQEQSRKPHTSPDATENEIVLQFLEVKARHPRWGAKKIREVAWPNGTAPISLRTANRILNRAQLTCKPSVRVEQATQRFERDNPNELWQIDFKGLKYPRIGYDALSIVDDASRFCVAFLPVPDQGLDSLWDALWDAFGEYGLPDCILSDNGPAFRAGATHLTSKFGMRLLKLGIKAAHGRPFHPQTQGKVERFHGSVEREIGEHLRQPTVEQAREIYAKFRQEYNWVRPHEALEMRTPATRYITSSRKRPSRLPKHELPEGAQSRSVDHYGNFGYKGGRYKIGRGLSEERVEVRESKSGLLAVYFFGQELAFLRDIEV
jgi:transposase InsO family protein